MSNKGLLTFGYIVQVWIFMTVINNKSQGNEFQSMQQNLQAILLQQEVLMIQNNRIDINSENFKIHKYIHKDMVENINL